MASFGEGFAQGFNATFSAASQARARRDATRQQAMQAAQARAADRVKQLNDILQNLATGFHAVTSQPTAPVGPPGTTPSRQTEVQSINDMIARTTSLLGQQLERAGLADPGQGGSMASLITGSALSRQRNVEFEQRRTAEVAAESEAAANLTTLPSELVVQQATGQLANELEVDRQRQLTPGAVDRAGQIAQAQQAARPVGSDLLDQTGNLSVSATNSLRGEVAGLFGGIFDPLSGRVSGIKREDAANALAVQVEAAKLLREGAASSIPEAAFLAFRTAQTETPEPAQPAQEVTANPQATALVEQLIQMRGKLEGEQKRRAAALFDELQELEEGRGNRPIEEVEADVRALVGADRPASRGRLGN